ncbi:unconventional prefoldin RPB5 interactor-like protein [Drosophila mojavensis]|uniref:Uncharacterized protein, isoform C n=1 Tax=Drosophila mojavensis TaxID=7230 RepID=B4KQ64_DROMO|nr:unconventional prefoldin RPB5 interactor-like protein [Drosophila mojavensis]EDW09192.2 uncharacterized protein Dmoj_GI19184, isoform C [Drosophila mojavensis]
MERREDVLRQALDKNAYETERWLAYKADNEVAIENLNMFAKNLSVEVMVPIGKKALMPGELIHTNEVLVGHYQGYFSACSAYKAEEICQHRWRLANEHLKKLQVEAELWQKNLETPILEGAVPKSDEIEIVEEYNETDHNNWLKEHKERVRKEKLAERAQREQYKAADAHKDVFQKLEERELLEELGLDPDNFSEQTLSELLPKEAPKDKTDCDKENATTKTDEEIFDMLAKLEAQEANEAADVDEEIEQNVQSTNEMVRNLMSGQMQVTPAKQRLSGIKNILKEEKDEEYVDQPELRLSGTKTISKEEEEHNAGEDHPEQGLSGMQNISKKEEEEDNNDEDDEDQPEEVKLIRQEMQLLPIEERQEFLNSQLQIIKAKMRKIQKASFASDELTHLMNVLICLEDDLQELLFEQTETANTDELSDAVSTLDNKKRRISFATADEELLFKKEETVAEMLTNGKQRQQREVIKLDASLVPPTPTVEPKLDTEKHSNSQIMQKVEENLEFVQQNQSVQDFDLVNQILEASTGRINTLHISFTHSDALPAAPTETDDTETPGTPAQLYELYKKAQEKYSFPIFVNGYEGEEELKVPIIKEEDRASAYADPRKQFNNPSAESSISTDAASGDMETKSILRNKSAVEREVHAVTDKPKQNNNSNKSKKNKSRKAKKERTIDDDLRDMSAYQKVMHDLIEKEPTLAPEPLPKGKFIDAHTPKKRISRFKEQRSMNKT